MMTIIDDVFKFVKLVATIDCIRIFDYSDANLRLRRSRYYRDGLESIQSAICMFVGMKKSSLEMKLMSSACNTDSAVVRSADQK